MANVRVVNALPIVGLNVAVIAQLPATQGNEVEHWVRDHAMVPVVKVKDNAFPNIKFDPPIALNFVMPSTD